MDSIIALKAQGQDSNTCDQAVVEASLSWLLELQPNIKAYDSDNPGLFLEGVIHLLRDVFRPVIQIQLFSAFLLSASGK